MGKNAAVLGGRRVEDDFGTTTTPTALPGRAGSGCASAPGEASGSSRRSRRTGRTLAPTAGARVPTDPGAGPGAGPEAGLPRGEPAVFHKAGKDDPGRPDGAVLDLDGAARPRAARAPRPVSAGGAAWC